jgi:hypothetical protein
VIHDDLKRWRKNTKEIRFLESFFDTILYQTVDVQTELEVSSLKGHFKPWHPDNYLILNSYGKLYKFDIQSKYR